MESNIDLSSIKSSQVDHLPIISHYAKQMGFEKIINELVPTEMDVEPGKIVLGMVIDILSGRSPARPDGIQLGTWHLFKLKK